MKNSPQMEKLEKLLRSSRIAGGGFLGNDSRPLEEIIECDSAELAETGYSRSDVVCRLKEIRSAAEKGLGAWVKVDESVEASISDTRGFLPCPWPHPGRYSKTVVTVRNIRSGMSVRLSDLNIHMIEEHGFFEGKGSPFRIEPSTLVKTVFEPISGSRNLENGINV